MLYSYETIDIKPKLNKKKVILLILIVLTIIAVAVYTGIYFSKKNTPYKGSLFYISLQIFLRKNV